MHSHAQPPSLIPSHLLAAESSKSSSKPPHRHKNEKKNSLPTYLPHTSTKQLATKEILRALPAFSSPFEPSPSQPKQNTKACTKKPTHLSVKKIFSFFHLLYLYVYVNIAPYSRPALPTLPYLRCPACPTLRLSILLEAEGQRDRQGEKEEKGREQLHHQSTCIIQTSSTEQPPSSPPSPYQLTHSPIPAHPQKARTEDASTTPPISRLASPRRQNIYTAVSTR